MTQAMLDERARGLWRGFKRVGPFVLLVGAIVYVVGRSQTAPTGEAIPTYVATMATPPDSVTVATRLHVPRGRDARFALVLRPSKPPATKIAAYAFAASGAEDPEPVDARFDVGGDGVIRVAGSGRPLEGATELRVVIGAPSAFAKFDDAAARAKSGKSDPFVQVTVLPIDRE